MTIELDESKILAYWKRRVPGREQELLELLRPFYSWTPRLSPPIPGLEECARDALALGRFRGIRTFKTSELKDLKACCELVLEDRLFDAFDSISEVEERVAEISEALTDSGLSMLLHDRLKSAYKSQISTPLMQSMLVPMLLACVFASRGSPYMNEVVFDALFKLWFAGNFPIGFDGENNLLVLVAD